MLHSWADLTARTYRLTRPPRAGSTCVIDRGVVTITGVKTPTATRDITVWLLRHTDQIAAQPWAHEMVTEITRAVAALHAKWPTEERPVTLPIPCPACGATSLTRHAPQWEGAPTTITCQLADCQHTVPEDRYDWLIRLHTTSR
jgi:hypothetical protein